MEIIDMKKELPDEFRLLEIGAVFQTDTGTFIKCSISEHGVNAVNLNNGAPAQFVLGAMVRPVTAKLIINDTNNVFKCESLDEDDMEF